MTSTAPRIRPAVRVLLIDDADRVLLFRAVNVAAEAPFWFPPGGAIEDGETVEEAAAREVEEETGLAGIELGPELWTRRHVFTWLDETIDQRERWFLARVPAFEIVADGWTEQEQREITEHRWWTLDQLHRADENLTPRALADLVQHLFDNGPQLLPIEVGI